MKFLLAFVQILSIFILNFIKRFIHADYRFDIGGYESYIGPEGDNKGSDFLPGSSKISASIGFIKHICMNY